MSGTRGYIDTPIVQYLDANQDGDTLDAGDASSYYTTDANHNVTALFDASAGNIQERYIYEPYGKVQVYDRIWGTRSSSTYENPIQFGGYFRDAETGLNYARSRYDNVSTGGWQQRDVGGYIDGGNLYQYVRSNPVHHTDPSGLLPGAEPTTKPSEVALPETNSGAGECPCAKHPELCHITVDFIPGEYVLKFPNGKISDVWNSNPFVDWSADSRAWRFGVGAIIKVASTTNDPAVTCCHLRQQAGRYTKTDEGVVNSTWEENDYSSEKAKKVKSNTYGGWWFWDHPTDADAIKPDAKGAIVQDYFSAYVDVEEAPKVNAWWGYYVSVSKNFPVIGADGQANPPTASIVKPGQQTFGPLPKPEPNPFKKK